ncbi:MAG: diacylglycerol kinase [Candidatus Giovannonibacteria bacterium GW2011_GWA2_53_7]|uniref:Diacylglycerol kinase n=1 Tax=Candidatus Giovannonibacteria bacterium GW2011_GWA2_53_7 TaxID=1618650 RepID=A0A0G1XT62_9BACT|nr:MAG: diacylglycerol kinase [Candidatus Giovannonibacteria bacterium GW2011_GWA2_53_7]
MSVKAFLKSIRYALRGTGSLWRSEQNFRIQVLAGVIVLVLMTLLPLETWERILLLLLVASVLVLEAINSVIERLVDVLKSRIHPSVRDMKDIMAATVLFASVLAAVIGAMILLPRVWTLLV